MFSLYFIYVPTSQNAQASGLIISITRMIFSLNIIISFDCITVRLQPIFVQFAEVDRLSLIKNNQKIINKLKANTSLIKPKVCGVCTVGVLVAECPYTLQGRTAEQQSRSRNHFYSVCFDFAFSNTKAKVKQIILSVAV